jgi:hypothetical protein
MVETDLDIPLGGIYLRIRPRSGVQFFQVDPQSSRFVVVVRRKVTNDNVCT